MDLLSSEYGWSTEYILSRTFKEIDYRLHAISRRKAIDFKVKAQLHGRKIKNLVIPKKREKISEESKKSIKEIINENKIKAAFESRMNSGKKDTI